MSLKRNKENEAGMSEYSCSPWPTTSTSLRATGKAPERRVVVVGSAGEPYRRWADGEGLVDACYRR